MENPGGEKRATGVLVRMKWILVAWFRDWRRHPLQRLLTLIGMMIAIAVVLAVDLANQSAQRAFDRSMDEVAGTATHQILGPVYGFSDALYTELRREGWRTIAPIVEGPLRRTSGETVYVLGVDPLAEGPFRAVASGIGELPIQRLLTEPGTVLVSPEVYSRIAAAVYPASPMLEVDTPQGVRILTPLKAPQRGIGESLWVTDIGTAQVLLNRSGLLDRVDVHLEDPEQIAELIQRLPDGLEWVPVAARGAAARELAQAFRINLTAMSLLALLISAFLIYNTQMFSVLRRLEVLDTLRRIGVSRARIFWVVILEALLVGLLGSLLGILLGLWLAQGLIMLVTQTVSDHFFVVAVTSVEPRPLTLLAVLLLGLGLSVLAAWSPAWESLQGRGIGVSGRAALEHRAARLARLVLWLGGVVFAVGILLAGSGVAGLAGGFLALFLVITGYLLVLPKLLAWGLKVVSAVFSRRFPWLLGRMASRGLEQGLSRSAPATVALTLALAAAIGVSVLVGSFRVSVAEWLGYTLTSDLYLVSAQPASARGAANLPGSWLEEFSTWPDVTSVSTATTHTVVSERGMVSVFVLSPHADWLQWLNLVEGNREGLEQRLQTRDSVLITESLAAHQQLGTGDQIAISTPMGTRTFRIEGKYRDYSDPGGAILLLADRYYGGSPTTVHSIGLRIADTLSLSEFEERIEDWLQEQSVAALLTSPAAIEEESMAIFDRTFAITHLLRVITLLVAFVAILSALVALQMERAREYAVLRAVGFWPAGVRQLVFLQGAMLGLFAALAAIPLGLGMGWMLIEVINREAFGWRMDILLPGWPLLENVALGMLAAALASIYPAWRLARMPLVPALRARD